MILYHGSNIEIQSINLHLGQTGKDFGKGFYLSDSKTQAVKMANMTFARTNTGSPIVTEFSFDENLLVNPVNLKIKTFNGYTEDWAAFVLANRQNKAETQIHDYDIVYGPIANDTVGVQIRRAVLGYITIKQLAKALKYIKPTYQYFFGTEAAISTLKKL